MVFNFWGYAFIRENSLSHKFLYQPNILQNRQKNFKDCFLVFLNVFIMLVWGKFVPPFYEGFEAHVMICFNGNALNSKCM